MNNWINAGIWIGDEKEGDCIEQRMFVDIKIASYYDVVIALDQYPDINALYYGHGITQEHLNYFFNKIRIIVEIDNVNQIPIEYLGKIELVLRIPNFISYIKTFDRDEIGILNLDKTKWNHWDCQKLYKDDVIVK
jgi:hypothetical protein